MVVDTMSFMLAVAIVAANKVADMLRLDMLGLRLIQFLLVAAIVGTVLFLPLTIFNFAAFLL